MRGLEPIIVKLLRMLQEGRLENAIPRDLPLPVGVANIRVKTGHDYLRKHLHRFGLADSPTCPLCMTADMSGDHLHLWSGILDVAAVNAARNYCNFVCVSELYWAARDRLFGGHA